ncbi:hypothetical protein BN946_scf184766.g45 [Trametes cinnabarina]|uniref:Uncharacterized protein n=1 Tax=Pycnoporus cinnabarinus TaxID=5643 RepID=A0A060S656_PYCCI|nr:hypothetical protein BN946_scf184766.g45 [Trametes cinnabarina]
MSLFSSEEARISKTLQKRIESWKTRVLSTQFQQYGPLDQFFNHFLSDDDFMVKPQALFHPEFEDVEASHLIKRYGIEDAGPDSRPVNPTEAQILQDTREVIEAGNLSIDSINVLVSKTLTLRKYPDFALCTFGENPRVEGGGQDQVLAIIEIASCVDKARLNDIKSQLMEQLLKYMDMC